MRRGTSDAVVGTDGVVCPGGHDGPVPGDQEEVAGVSQQVQIIVAGAGECPVPFPEKWTSRTAQEWAEGCQRNYRPGAPGPFQVTLRALRLWLCRDYERDAAEGVLELLRGFPE